ncbi:hypothetical protein PU560_00045, partial [Georgenia sp. 10Sc9-8]|nr:hypothetical protein [Georgenia halotolerans]
LDPAGEADRYTYSISTTDTYGKEWIEYSVVASDGLQETTLGPVRVDLVDDDADSDATGPVLQVTEVSADTDNV